MSEDDVEQLRGELERVRTAPDAPCDECGRAFDTCPHLPPAFQPMRELRTCATCDRCKRTMIDYLHRAGDDVCITCVYAELATQLAAERAAHALLLEAARVACTYGGVKNIAALRALVDAARSGRP